MGKKFFVGGRQWQEMALICGIKTYRGWQIRKLDLGGRTQLERLAGRMFREED